MSTSVIEELRLTAFKSLRDARLPLGALTLLIGRNGAARVAGGSVVEVWTLDTVLGAFS